MSDSLSVTGRRTPALPAQEGIVDWRENPSVLISGLKVTSLNNVVSFLGGYASEAEQTKSSFRQAGLFSRGDNMAAATFDQLLARVIQTVQIRARNDHQNMISRYERLIGSVKKGVLSSIDQLKDYLGCPHDGDLSEENNTSLAEAFLILSSESLNHEGAERSCMQDLARQIHESYAPNVESFISAYAEAMSADETEQFLRAGARGFIFGDVFLCPPSAAASYAAGMGTTGAGVTEISGLEIAGAFSWVCTSLSSADDMLSYLQQKFDSASLDQAIMVMMKTVSSGLCESAAFTDRDSLQVLGRNLSSLQHLRSALSSSGQFIESLQKIAEEAANAAESANADSGPASAGTGSNHIAALIFTSDEQRLSCQKDLISRVVRTAMKGAITSKDVRDIVREVKVMDCTSEVILAQSFMSFIKNLSDQLFSSLESRNRLIAAAQEMIDKAIQAEDKYLASLELDE